MTSKKNPLGTETRLRYGIRKFSGIGLASALLGMGVVHPSFVQANTHTEASIQYHYVTTDELTAEEKQAIVSELPKEVTNDATYYLVYRANTNQHLPKNNVQNNLIATGLGSSLLVIAIGLGYKKKKMVRSILTLTVIGGSLTVSSVSALTVNLLAQYSHTVHLTAGEALPDGKLVIPGYSFVGYLSAEQETALPTTQAPSLEEVPTVDQSRDTLAPISDQSHEEEKQDTDTTNPMVSKDATRQPQTSVPETPGQHNETTEPIEIPNQDPINKEPINLTQEEIGKDIQLAIPSIKEEILSEEILTPTEADTVPTDKADSADTTVSEPAVDTTAPSDSEVPSTDTATDQPISTDTSSTPTTTNPAVINAPSEGGSDQQTAPSKAQTEPAETRQPQAQTLLTRTIQTTEETPYQVIVKEDPSLAANEVKVESEGSFGKKITIHKVTLLDGIEQGRELLSSETLPASDRIVRVGPKTASLDKEPTSTTKLAEPSQQTPDAEKSKPSLPLPASLYQEAIYLEISKSDNTETVSNSQEIYHLIEQAENTISLPTFSEDKHVQMKEIVIYDNSLLVGQRHIEAIEATYVTASLKRRRQGADDQKEDQIETLHSKDIPLVTKTVRVGTKQAYALSGYVFSDNQVALEETPIQVLLDGKLVEEIQTDVEGYTYSHFQANKTYTLKAQGFEARISTNEKHEAKVENIQGEFRLGQKDQLDEGFIQYGNHVLFLDQNKYQSLSDNGKQVIISHEVKAKKGDIVVIPPTSSTEGQKALKVVEITTVPNRTIIIYEKPALFEVIDKLDVKNIEADLSQANFNPAPGVTVLSNITEDLQKDEMVRGPVTEFGRNVTFTATLNKKFLNKEKNFYKKSNREIKINGNLDLEISLGGKLKFETISLDKNKPNKMIIEVEPGVEFRFKSGGNIGFEGEVKIQLGDLENILGPIARLNIDLPIYIKLKGTAIADLSIEKTQDFKSKLRIEDWDLKIISDNNGKPNDPDSPTLNLAGELEFGFSFEPAIEVLETVDIATLELSAGFGVESEANVQGLEALSKLIDKVKFEPYLFAYGTLEIDLLKYFDESESKKKQ